MTLARVRRPTCEARSAAWKASPSTYTPPWKYRTTWRGSSPSIVISAVGTPPSAAAVTVTSAGSGCADVNSRSSRRCSLTSLPTGKADCRRTASRFSRCSVLTEDLPSVGLVWQRSGCSSWPLESDEVDAGERMVDLLNRAACCQVAEIDRGEARVLEQRADLRFRVGAGDEDHALAAGFVWIRTEHFGAQRVGGFDEPRAGHEVGEELTRCSPSLVASMTI